MALEHLIETTALANRLLKEFGLAEQGWRFEFSNRKTQVGTCFYSQKKIVFSKWYVESHPDEIEDTIRHEIAHALVGPDHGHDHVWRRKCIEVGAKPYTCVTPDAVAKGHSVSTAKYNWLLYCDNQACPNVTQWKQHRLSRAAKFSICPNCRQPLLIKDLRNGKRYRSAAEGSITRG